MPKGDDENGCKGQVCSGTIPIIKINVMHNNYYLCGKFLNCLRKCTNVQTFAHTTLSSFRIIIMKKLLIKYTSSYVTVLFTS